MTRSRQQAPTLAGILERERRDAEREGPPKRRSREHGELVRDTRQTVDARGDIADPWRTPSLLERLEEAGEITRAERAAGEEFQRLFRVAALDELRASDLGRVIVSGSAASTITPRCEQARGRIREAIKAVGGDTSHCGLACWYLLGIEVSLRELAVQPAKLGRRPLSREAAKGALVGALGMLERFFGQN